MAELTVKRKRMRRAHARSAHYRLKPGSANVLVEVADAVVGQLPTHEDRRTLTLEADDYAVLPDAVPLLPKPGV